MDPGPIKPPAGGSGIQYDPYTQALWEVFGNKLYDTTGDENLKPWSRKLWDAWWNPLNLKRKPTEAELIKQINDKHLQKFGWRIIPRLVRQANGMFYDPISGTTYNNDQLKAAGEWYRSYTKYDKNNLPPGTLSALETDMLREAVNSKLGRNVTDAERKRMQDWAIETYTDVRGRLQNGISVLPSPADRTGGAAGQAIYDWIVSDARHDVGMSEGKTGESSYAGAPVDIFEKPAWDNGPSEPTTDGRSSAAAAAAGGSENIGLMPVPPGADDIDEVIEGDDDNMNGLPYDDGEEEVPLLPPALPPPNIAPPPPVGGGDSVVDDELPNDINIDDDVIDVDPQNPNRYYWGGEGDGSSLRDDQSIEAALDQASLVRLRRPALDQDVDPDGYVRYIARQFRDWATRGVTGLTPDQWRQLAQLVRDGQVTERWAVFRWIVGQGVFNNIAGIIGSNELFDFIRRLFPDRIRIPTTDPAPPGDGTDIPPGEGTDGPPEVDPAPPSDPPEENPAPPDDPAPNPDPTEDEDDEDKPSDDKNNLDLVKYDENNVPPQSENLLRLIMDVPLSMYTAPSLPTVKPVNTRYARRYRPY